MRFWRKKEPPVCPDMRPAMALTDAEFLKLWERRWLAADGRMRENVTVVSLTIILKELRGGGVIPMNPPKGRR
jgi:hypothetical protein